MRVRGNRAVVINRLTPPFMRASYGRAQPDEQAQAHERPANADPELHCTLQSGQNLPLLFRWGALLTAQVLQKSRARAGVTSATLRL